MLVMAPPAPSPPRDKTTNSHVIPHDSKSLGRLNPVLIRNAPTADAQVANSRVSLHIIPQAGRELEAVRQSTLHSGPGARLHRVCLYRRLLSSLRGSATASGAISTSPTVFFVLPRPEFFLSFFTFTKSLSIFIFARLHY